MELHAGDTYRLACLQNNCACTTVMVNLCNYKKTLNISLHLNSLIKTNIQTFPSMAIIGQETTKLDKPIDESREETWGMQLNIYMTVYPDALTY